MAVNKIDQLEINSTKYDIDLPPDAEVSIKSVNASSSIKVNGADVLTAHQSIKTLDTTATSAQSASSDEAIAGTGKFTLHKISKTGNYNDLLNKPTLGTAASKNTGTASGNVPVLDSNGKLADSVIPAVAITDTYEASSQDAMLKLGAQKGDICIRSDLNKSFVLQTTPASTLGNWKELKTPTDAVLSVNGKTGAVQLAASDVGALPSDTKYAASSSVGGVATSAAKLSNTAKIGDTNKPVYFTANGVPTAISYTIEKSVPSNAVFTDTKNTAGSTNSTSKLFLVGASTQAANPQTYSNSAVYTQNGKLYSNNTEVSVDGHTHSFDTITSRGEAFLSWGGKNFSGTYGPIDAAMVPELGANRLAFMPADAVTIEYSRDGGSTWTDYGPTDPQKIDLFNGRGSSFIIGKATSGAGNIATNKYQLRVNIYTSAGKVYTALNKFVIYLSTNGTNNNWCTIRARKQSDYTADNDTWTTFADKISVSGWSGYNVINTSGITTYGNTASTQYGHIQFIFGCDTGSTNNSYPGLQINKIFGFGGVGWTTPSTMAKTGNMYTYDSSQNVTFPAGVSAKSFTEGGKYLADKYLGKTAKAADADKLDGNDSTYYLNYNNLSNKPTIPTVPTALKNPNSITFKAGSETVLSYDGSAAKTFTIDASTTNGAFTISDGTTTKTVQLAGKFTDNNTTYSAGTGLQLSGTTFSAKLNSTASLGTIGSTSKLYAVGVDANGKLCVNVPWTDTNTDTHYTNYLQIKGNGTEAVKFEQNANKTLNLKPGNNVSISAATNEITISATVPTKSSWNYDDMYVKYTAAQSLTDAQKSQARTNIGAGTSSLAIGTTASTAAAGNHTHSTTLSTDSGAATVTMDPNTTYKLSTGGTNVIFKTPSDAYKIVETLRKGSEADSAVGYYKIATINHVNWNFCDFCMLVKNSYAGVAYSTIFNCSCSDSNVDLRDFKLEIISGTDISNKLSYLYTYDSSNNLIKIEVFIHATRFEHPMCYIINARPGQQLVIPTQDEFNKATPDKPDGTTMTGYAKPDNRRLLNHELGVMLENTTTDKGWGMFNPTYTGYLLQSVRFNANSPAWGVGNYGAGIIFGGADTKGVISTGYGSPLIKFASGNGSGPVWWIGLTGTSGTSYDLDELNNKQDKISALGTETKPVYFSSDGVVSACLNYGGGTKVTLNGTEHKGTNATLYAPTTAGTSGYSLKSNGSGAPRWAKSRNVSVGSTITSGAKNCSSVSFLIGNSSTDSHLTKGLWYYSGTYGVFIVYVVNEITKPGSAKTEYISGYVSSQITSNMYITLVEL